MFTVRLTLILIQLSSLLLVMKSSNLVNINIILEADSKKTLITFGK